VHAALRAVPGTPLDHCGWPAPPRFRAAWPVVHSLGSPAALRSANGCSCPRLRWGHPVAAGAAGL